MFEINFYSTTSEPCHNHTDQDDIFRSVLNLNLLLLSLVCPAFSSPALEDLSRVNSGALTFEENPGKHWELFCYTCSNHGRLTVTPKSALTSSFLLEASVFSAASLSSLTHQSPSFHEVSWAHTVWHVLESSWMGPTLPAPFPAPLIYLPVGIAGALLTKCRGALCSLCRGAPCSSS